jgi:hypothetical protein
MSFYRTASQKPLSDLISPEYFTARGNGDTPVESNTMYRIALHQRFPSWPLNKKQKLVDSIFRNYPIHAIIAFQHIQERNPVTNEYCPVVYSNIEDGQTRMTSLQEFLLNEFPCEEDPDRPETSGKLFKELDPVYQALFKNYQVTLEVFSGRGRGITDDVISDIFNRLNSGKPLGDNDKYHSRMNTPIMQLLSWIKMHLELRADIDKFIGPIGTGKTRKGLGDMVGTILAIATRHDARGGQACINTSYEQNYKYLSMEASAEQKTDIVDFFKAYFDMLNKANGVATAKPKKNLYSKLSGVLGLSVCSWIINNGTICDEIVWYVKQLIRNPKYEPETFRDLTKGDIRNCQGASVARRLVKIKVQMDMGSANPMNALFRGQAEHLVCGNPDVSEDDSSDTD